MGYQDILNKLKKDWDCPDMMDADKRNIKKIPFSSPLLNYSTYGGIPRNAITEFHGMPSGGKAQPLYSKILTPNGWIEMGDVVVGQTVYSGDGSPTIVDGVFPQGERDVYELHFSDRTSIRVADNHLNSFWRWNRESHAREDYCITTQELIELYNNPKDRYSKFRVDTPIVEWPHQDVPVDPYLLGALIGDGSLAGALEFNNSEQDVINKVDALLRRDWGCCLVRLSSSDVTYNIKNIDTWQPLLLSYDDREFDTIPQLQSYLRDKGYPSFDYITIRKCANGTATYTLNQYPELRNIIIEPRQKSGRARLMEAIESLGLTCKSIDKHIPDVYLFNDSHTRLELLRGLYDTDGYTPKNNPEHGTTGSGTIFSTSSQELSSNLEFLVRSLGIVDTVVVSPGKYRDPSGQIRQTADSYTHYMKVPNDMCIFTSMKHASRHMPRLYGPYRSLVDITYVGKEECQCIHVESPVHTYITDNITVTHNTSTALDVCNNAVELFKQEFEEEVSRLRDLVAKGKKEFAGPLEDLIDRGRKRVLYVDIEHSYDRKWAQVLKIDPDAIDVMQPPNIAAEEILEAVQNLIETGEIGLVVLDSIPSLVPKAELEKKYGERTVASLAGLLTVFTRKIVSVLTRNDCTLLIINQIRDNMDNPYVVNTPGGQALKFYCSLRMLFRLGTGVDFVGNELPSSAENPAGYIVNVKIVKQKSAPFDRRIASYYLMAQSGIRPDFDFAKLAINKYGIIKKAGAWFTFCDPTTGEIVEEDGKPAKVNGMPKVLDWLEAHPNYYNILRKYIISDIEGVEFDADEILPSDSTVDAIEAVEDISEEAAEGVLNV